MSAYYNTTLHTIKPKGGHFYSFVKLEWLLAYYLNKRLTGRFPYV